MIKNTQITKREDCLPPIITHKDHNLDKIQFPGFGRWEGKMQMNYGVLKNLESISKGKGTYLSILKQCIQNVITSTSRFGFT